MQSGSEIFFQRTPKKKLKFKDLPPIHEVGDGADLRDEGGETAHSAEGGNFPWEQKKGLPVQKTE